MTNGHIYGDDEQIPHELESKVEDKLNKNQIFEEYDDFMRAIYLTDYDKLNEALYKQFQKTAKDLLPKRGFLPTGTRI